MNLNPDFIRPQYNSNCFAQVPGFIRYQLTGSDPLPSWPENLSTLSHRYKNIVLFFLDSFGWRFLERFQDHAFLKETANHGTLARFTSMFPSTTAVHVTGIHTGLPPGQGGVIEWRYYEPTVDAMILPLPFSYSGTQQRETLKSDNVDPADLYPANTFYPSLTNHGVQSFVYQPREVSNSSYSTAIAYGAERRGYKTLPEVLVNIRELIAQRQSKTYCCCYFDKVDSISHDYGPDSPQVEAEIEVLLTTLDHWFLRPASRQLKDTLVIFTADHGQIGIEPQRTIYLNLDARFAGIERYLKTNQRGELLVPGGSPRDMMLYIRDDLLAEAQSFLSTRLAGIADVCLIDNLVEQGYFGPLPVSDSFRRRVGNLMILAYAGQLVWWYEKDKYEVEQFGHHGGLTPDEMEIPLLTYAF